MQEKQAAVCFVSLELKHHQRCWALLKHTEEVRAAAVTCVFQTWSLVAYAALKTSSWVCGPGGLVQTEPSQQFLDGVPEDGACSLRGLDDISSCGCWTIAWIVMKCGANNSRWTKRKDFWHACQSLMGNVVTQEDDIIISWPLTFLLLPCSPPCTMSAERLLCVNFTVKQIQLHIHIWHPQSLSSSSGQRSSTFVFEDKMMDVTFPCVESWGGRAQRLNVIRQLMFELINQYWFNMFVVSRGWIVMTLLILWPFHLSPKF